MEKASNRLDSWINAGSGDAGLEEVRGCLDDDLNTPEAVKAIDEQVLAGNGISQAAMLLGVDVEKE